MPRSAREIDLDPRTFVGLSFPIRADNNNSFAMTKNSIQQSRHNLRNLLLTYPGERVGNSEFGCRLREVCFEQRDDGLPTKIKTVIMDAVNKFLPYISIIDIETLNDDGDNNKVFVNIKYSTTLDPSVNQELTVNATDGSDVNGNY
tara:strand:+ start:81 stop:518 length:438 start_codon:yes stop_codon:yes gene_type:complete